MSAVTPIDALRREATRISEIGSALSTEEWSLDTPAEGWTVTDQFAHLTSVYQLAASAVQEPEAFRELLKSLSEDFTANVAAAMAPLAALPPDELLTTWNETAAATTAAFEGADPERVVPWLVSPIPVGILAMAGVTEAFAHGQDIRDAVGREWADFGDLRIVAEFAYHTRTFGYDVRGRRAPAKPLTFDLVGPGGEEWTIGDQPATNVVRGPASDFALLVTRRRHPDDLDLEGTTEFARDWMHVAQAYRGPAGEGRRAHQFN